MPGTPHPTHGVRRPSRPTSPLTPSDPRLCAHIAAAAAAAAASDEASASAPSSGSSLERSGSGASFDSLALEREDDGGRRGRDGLPTAPPLPQDGGVGVLDELGREVTRGEPRSPASPRQRRASALSRSASSSSATAAARARRSSSSAQQTPLLRTPTRRPSGGPRADDEPSASGDNRSSTSTTTTTTPACSQPPTTAAPSPGTTAPTSCSSRAAAGKSNAARGSPSPSAAHAHSPSAGAARSPSPPRAGLKGMALAAQAARDPGARGVNDHGVDTLADDLSGSGGGGEGGEDGHPLSEKRLDERGYHSFLCLGRPFHVEKRWKLVRELGQGAYGLVVSAQDDISGETIAIKMVTRVLDKAVLARRALREITLLRHFASHENITGLIDLDVVHPGFNEVYMFMEPMEADLHQIIRSGQLLSNSHVQYFMYQLFRGMKYVHSANVLHRDIKPGNVLVNADCELKICDFGLARGFSPATGSPADGAAPGAGSPLTEYVATRWYRAPEIMLSYRRYTTAIDVWSIGCILAELLGGKPVFKGKDYVDQLNLILAVLGTPDDETLTRVGSDKAGKYIRSLPAVAPVPFATLFPEADELAIDLLSKLLVFDPEQRISVVQALAHPYLASYHDEADEPSCPVPFDKWAEVEALSAIPDFRAAIEREVAEFRAEVRAVDEYDPPWTEGAEHEGEAPMLVSGESPRVTGDGEEPAGSRYVSEMLAGAAAASSTSSGAVAREHEGVGPPHDSTASPAEGAQRVGGTSSPARAIPGASSPPGTHAALLHDGRPQAHDAAELEPPHPLLDRPISRSVSPSYFRPSASTSSLPREAMAAAATSAAADGAPLSAHPVRPGSHSRSASRSSNHRRPSSGFFDPFSRRPHSLAFTPSPSASAHPSPAHSGDVVRPPRSRHHSGSGDALMRPLLRSLSTISVTDALGNGLALGGFSKIDPAPPATSPPPPPMDVTPSDAPPSAPPLALRPSSDVVPLR